MMNSSLGLVLALTACGESHDPIAAAATGSDSVVETAMKVNEFEQWNADEVRCNGSLVKAEDFNFREFRITSAKPNGLQSGDTALLISPVETNTVDGSSDWTETTYTIKMINDSELALLPIEETQMNSAGDVIDSPKTPKTVLRKTDVTAAPAIPRKYSLANDSKSLVLTDLQGCKGNTPLTIRMKLN